MCTPDRTVRHLALIYCIIKSLEDNDLNAKSLSSFRNVSRWIDMKNVSCLKNMEYLDRF